MSVILIKVPEWVADLFAWLSSPLPKRNEYDDEWDRLILDAIKNDRFGPPGEHTVPLGQGEVWILNYPYGYGNPFRPQKIKARPSRRTMRLLREHLQRPNSFSFDVFETPRPAVPGNHNGETP